MGTTKITWADYTLNPVWGCFKVSPGCTHCYAETISHRFYPGERLWGPVTTTSRQPAHERAWREPLQWQHRAERTGVRLRVFCGSMCDVAEDHPDWVTPRQRLVELIAATPNLDWLLLTKRPENFRPLFPWKDTWPANVWAGTSVENQAWADIRIPVLIQVPAKIRFLSCEPLLGPVSLYSHLRGHQSVYTEHMLHTVSEWQRRIQWVIVGAESGAERRPMQLDWVRNIRDRCAEAGTAFFFKQTVGPMGLVDHAPLLDGVRHAAWPDCRDMLDPQ